MKFKPVVASVVALGLMAPAFAKSTLPSRQAVANQNNVVKTLSYKGWQDRISIGGQGSVVAAVGVASPPGMFQKTSSGSDLYVNNFNLITDVALNKWAKATANLAYIGAPIPFVVDTGNTLHNVKVNALVFDEAYITIGDLAKKPYYFKFGKMYLPFGKFANPYTPYAVMSPVQALSQFNAVAAVTGFVTESGIYGNLFGFRGDTAPMGSKTLNIRNFGTKLGFNNNLSKLRLPDVNMNLSVSYIHNLWDSQVFSPNAVYSWGNFNSFEKPCHPDKAGKIDRVGGIAANLDLNWKSFNMAVNFVTSIGDMIDANNSYLKDDNGAINISTKFWALDAGIGYSFNTCGRDSSVNLGAQFTNNGSWMGNNKEGLTGWLRTIPKWRLVGEYKVNLIENVDLSLMAAHGKSYAFVATKGRIDTDPAINTKDKTTVGLLSLNVKF